MGDEDDDGKIRGPRYDDARRNDDIEGELAGPAMLLEHAAAVEFEPEPKPKPAASVLMEALSVVP